MPVDRSLNNLVSDRIKEAAEIVTPTLHRLGLPTATLNVCFHSESRHTFILLQGSDGAIVLISPETDASATWLQQQVPDAVRFEQGVVAEWANKQHWEAVASQEVHATADAAHDSSPALADLDAQWQLFRDLLDDAYRAARQQVQDLPDAATHPLLFRLHTVHWTNDEQIHIGIYVDRERSEANDDVH